MLDTSHVLDLIASSESPINHHISYSDFVDKEKSFKQKKLDDHEGGFVTIHQEFPHNSKVINNIVSFHKNIEDVPFSSFTRRHTVYPVSNELLNRKVFDWSKLPRD